MHDATVRAKVPSLISAYPQAYGALNKKVDRAWHDNTWQEIMTIFRMPFFLFKQMLPHQQHL